MKRLFTLGIILAAFINIQNGYSQFNPKIINAKETIDKGVEYYDTEKYDSAIICFKLVNCGDSAYFQAQYELSLTYLAKKDYSKTIAISKNAIDQGSSEPLQYNTWGTALDESGEAEEAINIYNKGIERFPYNTSLLFNKAIVCERLGNYKAALDIYKSILGFSPYHASTHLRIARLCKEDGWLTQAIMAYTVFLIIEPSSNRSLNVLVELNKLCDGSLEGIGTSKKKVFVQEFEDLDVLISNQVALNSKYTTPSDYTYPVIKQVHLVSSQLKEIKNVEKNFFGEYYVPFFKKIVDLKSYNNFSLLLLASSDNQKIANAIEKNLEDVRETRNICNNYLRDTHLSSVININGKDQILDNWFNSNLEIQSFGKENSKGENNGDFLFLNSDGGISILGQFKNGLKVGKWVFFTVGGDTLKCINYSDDKFNGEYKIYNNGLLSEKGYSKDGFLEGTVLGFYPDQSIKSRINFIQDKRTGTANFYYTHGQISAEENYIDGELTGVYKEFHVNGNPSVISNYTSGKLEGNYKVYFNDGTLSRELNYKDGIIEGKYQSFHRNGKLASEGIAAKGSVSGNWKYYFSDGNLSSTSSYDENGKLTGVEEEYDYSGRLFRKSTYVKGDYKEIINYDTDGKIIYHFSSFEKDSVFKKFDFQRNNTCIGTYRNNKKVGEWKYFFSSGELNVLENYIDGKLEGETRSYYPNGEICEKRIYLNNELNGPFIRYFQNGELEIEGNYKDGEKWGQWFEYYDNGTLKSDNYYIKGINVGNSIQYDVTGKIDTKYNYKLDGLIDACFTYDTNGVTVDSLLFETGSLTFSLKTGIGNSKVECTYKNGLFYGDFKTYYSNSQLKTKGQFFAGKSHGEWIYYYPNGKVDTKGSFYHGDRIGVWEAYDFFGNKKTTTNYQYGLNHGLLTWYAEDQTVEAELDFFEDERHNKSIYYSNLGELSEVRYYSHGYFLGYSYLNKDNELVDTIFLTKGDGLVKTFYPNGKVSTEYSIYNGAYKGSFKKYNSDGNLYEERFYNSGLQNGPQFEYFNSGKIKRTENYCNGVKSGEVTEYNPDGSFRLRENYLNGELHGKCEYFDTSGVCVNAYEYYNGYVLKTIL